MKANLKDLLSYSIGIALPSMDILVKVFNLKEY